MNEPLRHGGANLDDPVRCDAVAESRGGGASAELVEDELIEEISIDGMCGVY